ncbi:hypothetical protein BCV69DRAFT_125605 [Microstroma glucosiphilum]|uniref:Uncharacterized protein n=1 Tax=Pseudomicrostroma glucosiphilum TaxID=1684307 RepID=A0A316TWN4_9BASI|nr:hypothetical protein BCV69DRAFT_125605 [Pseudomicrostroma glucosiphilum]PWN17859.1 hypothetical protein BCV69DRAFT_125605 [Pseudomicrostroma glucosiphilum]
MLAQIDKALVRDMQYFIDDSDFLRRSPESPQPLSRANLEKFNASPPKGASRSPFDLFRPAQHQWSEEDVTQSRRTQQQQQDGPKLWLSPHTADCFLVVSHPTTRPRASAVASRSITSEQQAASSPMAISNLVWRESSPASDSPPQSTTSSRKRSRDASPNTEASPLLRPLASLHEAAEPSSSHDILHDDERNLRSLRLVASSISQHLDSGEQTKRRKSSALPAYSQRTGSSSNIAPGDRPLPSSSSSAASSAQTGRRDDVRVYRVHKSIMTQCNLLWDLFESASSSTPPPVMQSIGAATAEGRRHSESSKSRPPQLQRLACPSFMAKQETVSLMMHRRPYPPSKRFPGLSLPTLLPSGVGTDHSSPVSPTSAPAGASFKFGPSQAKETSALNTVHMPVPDGETIPVLLHYLYHHSLSHLATALNRQATASVSSTDGRSTEVAVDKDKEKDKEEHYRRLVGGLIANFDYLGVEAREPREWLANEWKRLSTTPTSGDVAMEGERLTSLGLRPPTTSPRAPTRRLE